MQILLILTSAVNIKKSTFMSQNSPELRAAESIKSIIKWKKHTNLFDILVCDNTGYEYVQNEGITILKFRAQKFNQDLGKGYGEYLTLNYAIENIKDIEKYDYIMKCNCRYYISNIKKIIKLINKQSDMYIDFHNNLKWADSRFFIMRTDLFIELIECLKDINDKNEIYFEHILSSFSLSKIIKGEKWNYIPLTPRIIGVSGTTGKKYTLLRYLIKNIYQNILRVLIKI
jgi:hypothetical protein